MDQNEFKTIYLLTDFSDHSRNAAQYAIEAFGSSVKYLLINAYYVRSTAGTLIDIEEMAHQESVAALQIEQARLMACSYDSKLRVETRSKYGSPADAINDLLEDFPADLIVVGSKGQTRLDELLIGSVTTSIIRAVKKPVLTIPLKAKFEQFDQIVLARDLNNTNNDVTDRTIAAIKKQFGSTISAITVRTQKTELDKEEKALLAELESNSGIDSISVVSDENVSKGIMNYCYKNNTDLLVVVAKHTSFFKRFFHNSITKELVNSEVLPILVLEDN